MVSGRVKCPDFPWMGVLEGLGQPALQLATLKAAALGSIFITKRSNDFNICIAIMTNGLALPRPEHLACLDSHPHHEKVTPRETEVGDIEPPPWMPRCV